MGSRTGVLGQPVTPVRVDLSHWEMQKSPRWGRGKDPIVGSVFPDPSAPCSKALVFLIQKPHAKECLGINFELDFLLLPILGFDSLTASVTCRNLVLQMLQPKSILQMNPALIASFQSLTLGKMNKHFLRKDHTESG